MVLLDQEIPVVYIISDTSSKTLDSPVSVVYETTTSGNEVVEVAYYLKDASTNYNNVVSEIEFQQTDGFEIDSEVELEVGDVTPYSTNIISTLFESETQPKTIELPTDLFLYSFLNDGALDSKNYYRLKLGTVSVSRDMVVDLTLAEAHYFNTLVDVFCTTSGTLYNISGDIRYQSGTIYGLGFDVYVSGIELDGVLCDLYSAQINNSNILSDVQKASGTCVSHEVDIFNSALSTGSFGADFKTRSLFTSGFFLDVDSFTVASGVGYVDIIDHIYEVDESTIYILKDYTTISGIVIQDIPKGKRVFFNPIDDFYATGEIIITVYAESTYGEVLEEDFYLLFGYDLEFAEPNVFWDANTRIYVTATANNAVVCPNKEGAHYFFDTAEIPSFNLAAYINAISYVNLPCSIYPRSTAFYYGQTYTVRVKNVKDFHGNIMPDFEYSFTIESPEV